MGCAHQYFGGAQGSEGEKATSEVRRTPTKRSALRLPGGALRAALTLPRFPVLLRRYVNECTFRLNEGNVRRHTFERMDSLVDSAFGRQLTYEALTA